MATTPRPLYPRESPSSKPVRDGVDESIGPAASNREVDRLLRIVESMKILRDDLARREQEVNERERRVWGWRLIAAARDTELERETKALAERDANLREREASLILRESKLKDREVALDHRAILLEEEVKRQLDQVRDEVSRLRSRALGL